MSKPDLYAVLGVDPTATRAEIDRAFRALARRYHPDTRSADADAEGDHLRTLLDAHAILRDPERRAAYDRERRTSERSTTAETVEVHHRMPPRRPDPDEPDLRVGPVRWHGRPR